MEPWSKELLHSPRYDIIFKISLVYIILIIISLLTAPGQYLIHIIKILQQTMLFTVI